MLAIVVDPAASDRFKLREISRPAGRTNEVLVRVSAISLDRWDIDHVMRNGTDHDDWVGDFAGYVESAASDGSGPAKGARVAGLVRGGSWRQWLTVPADCLIEIPASLSMADAATLPTSGLTALAGLDRAGLLTGKRVLITRAAQGVGLIATQLAYLSGASVTAAVENASHEALLEEYGARHVIVGDLPQTPSFGSYDLILMASGSVDLDVALALSANNGLCMLHGPTTRPAMIDEQLLVASNITVLGLGLPHILGQAPPKNGLYRLMRLIKQNVLHPHLEFEADWSDINQACEKLENIESVGRAVLHIRTDNDPEVNEYMRFDDPI